MTPPGGGAPPPADGVRVPLRVHGRDAGVRARHRGRGVGPAAGLVRHPAPHRRRRGADARPAYLLGGAEIQRLRADAESALGPAFDLRRFHTAVLEDGSVALPMLRDKIARRIAAERGG